MRGASASVGASCGYAFLRRYTMRRYVFSLGVALVAVVLTALTALADGWPS